MKRDYSSDLTEQLDKVSESLIELSELSIKVSETQVNQIVRASELIWKSLSKNRKLLACGNGGSAADAQHFVAELVGRLQHERPALPAIALNVDPSVVTALANDYGYENVFARQVAALGQPGDVLLAISTSGKSPNILKALEYARTIGVKTVVLIGPDGCESLSKCDACIHVPSTSTQRIQEMHIVVLHAICEYIETEMIISRTRNKGDQAW